MSDERIQLETTPGLSSVDSELTRDSRAETSGIVIGHYHLLQRIGVGGMGEVWLAEQKEPIRRRVAVKLIKAGMDSREVVARFELERQTLALMDHPAIAKVLDAGSTPQGAPYFVMDYVAGLPITAYCDRHRLSTRERLDLFIQVCEGVQHAHQKAIIHRDLKPSNILVADVDNRAAPKIIDFGVAKALTQNFTAETMYTRLGTLLGTPEYMSPEQAGWGQDIDTRTDVYSLGIIFYELLAGAPPIELKKVAMEEFLRRLREDDPQKPSTKISKHDPATSTEVAHKRHTEPHTLAKQLQGELDSIALKALEKERSRRYATASEFVADVNRYLNNEPVLAVPPSIAYRSRKFARRHRPGLLMLGAFVLVLVAAAAVSIRQSVIARRQRDRADSEAAIAKAVNEFLQNDLLSQADPESQGGADSGPPDPEIKARTLLDRAAARVEKKFANQPLVESAIQQTIGDAYDGLGLAAQAEQHVRRAYELSAAHRGSDAPDTLDLLMALSRVLTNANKYNDAVTTGKAAFEQETRKLGPEDPRTVVAMQNLGALYLYTSQYAEAEPLLKKALEIQSHRNGYDNIDTLNTSDGLAELYIEQSRYAEARVLLAKGLDSYQRVFGPDHPFTARERFGLGKVLQGEGNYPEAENVFTEALAIEQRVRGKRHHDTLVTAERLGRVEVEEGKFAEAIPLLENTVRDFRETAGSGDYATLYCEMFLGWAYQSKRDLGRGELALRASAQGLRALGKDQEDDATDATELLGLNLVEQRKYSQAEPLLRQALIYREKGNRDDWRFFRVQGFLGADLNGLRQYPEAETLLLSGEQGLRQRLSRMPAEQKRWLRFSEDQLEHLYSDWGKPEESYRWRTRLQTP